MIEKNFPAFTNSTEKEKKTYKSSDKKREFFSFDFTFDFAFTKEGNRQES